MAEQNYIKCKCGEKLWEGHESNYLFKFTVTKQRNCPNCGEQRIEVVHRKGKREA